MLGRRNPCDRRVVILGETRVTKLSHSYDLYGAVGPPHVEGFHLHNCLTGSLLGVVDDRSMKPEAELTVLWNIRSKNGLQGETQ